MTSLDFTIIMPETLLAAYALLALLAGAYFGKDRIAGTLLWTTVAAFLVLAFYIGIGRGTEGAAFFGMFVADGFARFCKILILTSAAAVLAMSADYMQRQNMLRFEYPILIALSVIGMMFMVSAADLLTLYMGLELQSLALYVVAAMRRESSKSSEAGLKYFVLGSLSSGLLLYGASLIYGFAGTTSFSGIIDVVQGGTLPIGLLFGMVFVIVGLAFKVSAVPFHMWTPDVYEGAPTPVTAFFATAPKVAAMALLARVLTDAFGRVPGDWGQIIAVLALLSMFLGSIAGIGQTNIKRLMAYSSIAHMGFALMGLAAGTATGVQAMLMYMAIYAVMNVGVFAWILSLERDGQPVSDLAGLNQFAKTEPVKAMAILILFFSLAGVPPMLGFFAKLGVLNAAVDAGMGWLAVAGVIASVIGAFYYLRIVYYMYFGAETDPVDSRMGPVSYALLMASAAAVLLGSITMFGVDRAAGRAAESLMIVDAQPAGAAAAEPNPLSDRHPWPEGVARHVLPRSPSTNAEALRMAGQMSGKAWIITHDQYQGRGRRGRAWAMPAGNFAGSLALRPEGDPGQAALYSFVAALALYDALTAACGPAARLALKWPNDVLLNGGKVAGILLESAGQGPRVAALAVGIGVNLAAAPPADPDAAFAPVSVAGETGLTISPEDFLDLLAPAFAAWEARLLTEGFGPIRDAFLARAARLGETITARTGTAELTGRFEGIDQTGALILTTAAGRQAVPAADVFF